MCERFCVSSGLILAEQVGEALLGVVAIALIALAIWGIASIFDRFTREVHPNGGNTLSEHWRIEITDVDVMSGAEFEYFVAVLFGCLGYETSITPASNDFGVDVLAKKEGKTYAIQAKRYSGNVSRTAVSDAVAGKSHYKCDAALVVTSSFFTKAAISFAKSTSCSLIDRTSLCDLLDKHGTNPRLVSTRPSGATSSSKDFESADDELECWPSDIRAKVAKIPPEVRREILAQAKAENPGDFELQEIQFTNQCESYLRLRQYESLDD